MKYVWAREAGVNAAKYVIEKWSDLFPSQDCNPVSYFRLRYVNTVLQFCAGFETTQVIALQS